MYVRKALNYVIHTSCFIYLSIITETNFALIDNVFVLVIRLILILVFCFFNIHLIDMIWYILSN